MIPKNKLSLDSQGILNTQHYDKRDDFHFTDVYVQFTYSNTPVAPVKRSIYMFKLCNTSEPVSRYCLDKGLQLSRKLLKKGFCEKDWIIFFFWFAGVITTGCSETSVSPDDEYLSLIVTSTLFIYQLTTTDCIFTLVNLTPTKTTGGA